jgi:aminopeptidase
MSSSRRADYAAVSDPRVSDYARLLVERCVDVQAGWQVLVSASPLARPLVAEVARAIARRGAYALVRLALRQAEGVNADLNWALEAPEELLSELAPVVRHEYDAVDAFINIRAPENLRDGSELSPERQALLRQSVRPILERFLAFETRWVGCQYPTPALAQAAGMTVEAFADFLYGASLLDNDALHARLARVAQRFDGASSVRVVGAGTDLTFSLAGRRGQVDDGTGENVPGGEVFYSPIEDSAEGVVTFAEYPAVLAGHEVENVRLVFRAGRVVEASADREEEFLRSMLDADAGARVLGEFGIGANPGIRDYMRNTLFDEKIDGTVHFAVGAGFPHLGGVNTSALHWDMVKNLRGGGEIRCDGEVVQRDGEWLL